RARARVGLGLLLTGAVAVVALVELRPADAAPGRSIGSVVSRVSLSGPTARDTRAYAGQAAWVDAFDFGPAYQKAGAQPSVTPAVVDEMAAHGVRTLFLQATRADSNQPGGFVDRALVAEILVRAHRDGMRVVGWYLPTFADTDADLARMTSVARFNVLGHRFDGLAADIEDVDTVADVDVRNQRLVELSKRIRADVGSEALGAIVLPPVLTEVVNPNRWPDFPWSQLAPLYNVWLPMSYWTFRTNSSGYHDGYTYNDESIRRLRADLEDPDALVHGIGGIGDTATAGEITRFVQSLFDNHAIGGSLYDWNATPPESRDLMQQQFDTGPGASLPAPP
ncbi:MAG TPA: hypothetical protein VHI95_03855, partial [Acidimicrobiales bacterium]|nr:hypothetical protein [Acidimicrobiales bacterium]